jgi:hypothetical protein
MSDDNPMLATAEPTAADQTSGKRERTKSRQTGLRLVIIAVIVGWTYLYNVFIKGQGPVRAFFGILDTISDDFVTGTILTIGVGLGIVVVFSLTKLYTQIISNVYSFRIIEDLVYEDLRRGRYRVFLSKMMSFQDLPTPEHVCPTRVATLLFSLALLYMMSWIYVILFSEALFFVSWSAGVDLPLGDPERMLLLPTLALSLPFSARVMAYLRYPYAQDYADFMPGAVFVLLLVATLGMIFESQDQESFLLRVLSDRDYFSAFVKNGALLAFIPVFFEAVFWMLELNRQEPGQAENGGDQPGDD